MDSPANLELDPFFTALRRLPKTWLLPSALAEALLHLPPYSFDVARGQRAMTPPMTALKNLQGYASGDLMQYVAEDPARRGPIEIQHASFANFLIHGQLDHVWMFGLVLIDFHGLRRPVDLVSCIELPTDQRWGAVVRKMTLAEYVTAMNDYMGVFEEQRASESLAAERMRASLYHTPPPAAPANVDRRRDVRRKST